MKQFLHTEGRKIIDGRGRKIMLRGVNLGGWLMMEAYFLNAPNLAVHRFKDKFKKVLGKSALTEFENKFRANFVKENDIKNIKRFGFNCIRLPFNYRLIESKPFQMKKEGIAYLDKVISWARKYEIFIILDLHAAPGAQNHDWHSDSDGNAKLWTNKNNQRRTFKIWGYLANRYKNEYYVAGYDVLNEAVVGDAKKLNLFYRQLIKCIRKVDDNHILFIEGNQWATNLKCLDDIEDHNYVLSIHNYEPIDFTFNFVPHLTYPLKGKKRRWNGQTTLKHLSQYDQVSKKRNVPIFVGEFGVNTRQGIYGEQIWLDDVLKAFKKYDFHWTYWTYKAVKNYLFPDGIYSYKENPPWVRREGPLMGWENYHVHWPQSKQKMVRSWGTEAFDQNKHILDVLKKYAK